MRHLPLHRQRRCGGARSSSRRARRATRDRPQARRPRAIAGNTLTGKVDRQGIGRYFFIQDTGHDDDAGRTPSNPKGNRSCAAQSHASSSKAQNYECYDLAHPTATWRCLSGKSKRIHLSTARSARATARTCRSPASNRRRPTIKAPLRRGLFHVGGRTHARFSPSRNAIASSSTRTASITGTTGRASNTKDGSIEQNLWTASGSSQSSIM